MKKTTEIPSLTASIDFSKAYILNKGGRLQLLSPDYFGSSGESHSLVEKKFRTEREFAALVLKNGNTIFGEQTLALDYTNKVRIGFPDGFFPYGLLFDATDTAKPKLYVMEVVLSKNNLAYLLLKVTSVFSFFRKEENISRFAQVLGRVIQKNIGWRNQLKSVIGSKGVYEFLEELMRKPPKILLIMDSFRQDLKGFMETYTETWGKLVNPVLFRKFVNKSDTIFTMKPSFAEICSKSSDKEQKVKSTEEDHLESVSETVKVAFLQIKAELLKAGKEIEFRVKQYYISLRKNRNLAFFQLGKKKLSIVVMNPEKDTRRQVRRHTVKTLAESVQKFWNGECCTVVIENKEHLGEVISLLKKLVANGKSEETKSNIPVKNARAEELKHQVKPNKKGKPA